MNYSLLPSTFLFVYRLLIKGGMMILATWLSQAVIEEQTSVLNIILKVFFYHNVDLTHALLLIFLYCFKSCLFFPGSSYLATTDSFPCAENHNI